MTEKEDKVNIILTIEGIKSKGYNYILSSNSNIDHF